MSTLRLDPSKIKAFAEMSIPSHQLALTQDDQNSDSARKDYGTINQRDRAVYFGSDMPERIIPRSEDPRKKHYSGPSANRGHWEAPIIQARSAAPPANTDIFHGLCKWLYHEHGILAIHLQNERVSKELRNLMIFEGNAVYGNPKDNAQQILEFCMTKAENHEDARISELEVLYPEDFRQNMKALIAKGFIEVLSTPARVVKVLKNPGGGEYIPPLREEYDEEEEWA